MPIATTVSVASPGAPTAVPLGGNVQVSQPMAAAPAANPPPPPATHGDKASEVQMTEVAYAPQPTVADGKTLL